jgi:hypothetical protein
MALYFYNFPDITYEDGYKYKNIYRRYDINLLLEGYTDIYKTVKVDDNSSLESLSMQFYETKQYYWIIALANNMTDCLYDFPLKDEELRELAQKQFDAGLHATGYSVDQIYQDLRDDNDKKTTLKILKPQYVNILTKKMESASG